MIKSKVMSFVSPNHLRLECSHVIEDNQRNIQIGSDVPCSECTELTAKYLVDRVAARITPAQVKSIDTIFDKCLKMTMSKRQDYTSSPDNHENFKRSGEIASWFPSPVDKPYVILIGTKLARLASLLDSQKGPNHESIEDSFIDLINYAGLWAERRLSEVVKQEYKLGPLVKPSFPPNITKVEGDIK